MEEQTEYNPQVAYINPQLQYPQQYASGPTTSKKSPVTVIVIVLIVLLGLGGSAYAAYTYLYIQNPLRVFQAMLTQMGTVKSAAYQGEFNIDYIPVSPSAEAPKEESILSALQQIVSAEAANNGGLHITMKYNGQFDYRTQDDPRLRARFQLAANTDIPNEANMNFSIGAEIRYLQKALYLMLAELNIKTSSQTESEVTMFKQYLENVLNKWIKFDVQDSEALANNYGSTALGFSAAASPSSEEAKKIENIIMKYREKLFVLDRAKSSYQFEKETVDVYPWQVDKAVIKEMIIELARSYENQTLTEQQLAEGIKQIDELLNKITQLEGTLDISRSTNLLHKFTSKISYKDDKSGDFNVTSSSEFSKYNLAMNICAPDNAQSIEELMTSMYSSMYDNIGPDPISMATKANDTQRLTDITTLRKAIDIYLVSQNEKLPVCRGPITENDCTTVALAKLKSSGAIVTIPTDPKEDEEITTPSGKKVKAHYYYRSNGDEYKLAVYLEDKDRIYTLTQDGGTQADMFETGTDVSSTLGI